MSHPEYRINMGSFVFFSPLKIEGMLVYYIYTIECSACGAMEAYVSKEKLESCPFCENRGEKGRIVLNLKSVKKYIGSDN